MKNQWKEDIAQKDYILEKLSTPTLLSQINSSSRSYAAYATLWTSLLYVNPTGQSGRGSGDAIGRGNAGQLSQTLQHRKRVDQIPVTKFQGDYIIGAVLSLGGGIGVTITRSMFWVGEGGED